MPSQSHTRWTGERADALDEIESAHAVVGGTERGRRYATQQINYSYAMLLSSHFQWFCRDLHTECVDHLVTLVASNLQGVVGPEFVWNRSLDRGNPHPGAIGADFSRLGLEFWAQVYALDARNERRREMLQELIDWRNAIVHQDFDAVAAGGTPTLHLARVRGWRSALNGLARAFDQVVYNYVRHMLGVAPW